MPRANSGAGPDPEDMSQDIVKATWDKATPVLANVYEHKETTLWKNSNAYFKKTEDAGWKNMKDTGQWTVSEGWSAYLSGGEIRKAWLRLLARIARAANISDSGSVHLQ